MAKWSTLPPHKLLHHPYQESFWGARRQRLCRSCNLNYAISPSDGVFTCPSCSKTGVRAFHRLLMIAGRRGGKTVAGGVAAVEEACIPNTVGWCCAPTDPKLQRYVLPEIQRLIPESWVKSWNAEYKDLYLKNGSLIHFQTLEHPDQGRGQGLDWLWMDEICELSLKHWETIEPSLTEKRGVAFFTTSPRSYDWVYTHFYKKAAESYPGYWAARYKTSENPAISQEELDERKATTSDAMYRQEYEADFVVFEGAVYGGLVDPQILRTKADIQKVLPEWDGTASSIAPWRQVLVGIDTGADHPFGGVKLVSCEKGLVVVGEYLERNKTFLEHAQSLRMLANSPNPRWAINKNERQGMIELAQHGIFCQSAENDVVAGTERVKSWLHTKGLFFIEPLCPRTIDEMKTYRWMEDESKDGSLKKERVYKLNDELPDAIRYAVMTWPLLPKTQQTDANPPRDLSGMPPEIKVSIERMRRIEGREESEPTVVEDFW